MKTKRLLSAWLLAFLLPATVLADVWQDPETKVNYEYEPGSGVAKVTRSPEVVSEITILEKISVEGSDYVVTGIGNYAFYNCASFSDITIPSSVTSIGKYAFEG